MEKTPYRSRCNIRMAGLDITQSELAELVGDTQAKVAYAIGGKMNPASASLRVIIDQALHRRVDEKRKSMVEDLRKIAPVQAPHLLGELSLILPEDVMYIVLEDGLPVGLWSPESKSYMEFPPTLGL